MSVKHCAKFALARFVINQCWHNTLSTLLIAIRTLDAGNYYATFSWV